MKIIFLDIDGVLNCSTTFKEIDYEYKKNGKRRIEIDLFRMEYLKRIVDNTGALIVLSSSWRNYLIKTSNGFIASNNIGYELLNIFNQYGLSIYDLTPKKSSYIRQDEILSWMEGKDITNYVVIDDESSNLSKFINNGLINTNFTAKDNNCGLCENHVSEAIKILNNKKYILKK